MCFIFPGRAASHVDGNVRNLITVAIYSEGRKLYCSLSLCCLQSHAISSLLRHPIKLGRSQDKTRRIVIVNKSDNFTN